ncbi:MAG: hypothetical protein L0Y71_09610 [Gemmataceae bacterium]|nr:hypothetical protein [Gemmataceae bacterium]
MLRWVLGGVVSVIVGGYLLSRYFTGVPPLDQLATVTGDVASADVEIRRSRRSQSQFLSVRIDNNAAAFYLERFPDYERIVATIRPGDRVTALVDVGRNNYIWQLDKGGERLVSYDQVAEAQRSNDRMNALFGILFVVVGVGTIGVMLWQWKTASSAAPSGESTADPAT